MALIWKLKAAGEVKGAAFAFSALHFQLSAHFVDDAAGDGEAEAGSSKAPGGRAVGLAEGLEDARLLVFRDADAGVRDGELQGDRLGRSVNCIHRDHHLAAFGELDGIADEIDDDLPKYPGSADTTEPLP